MRNEIRYILRYFGLSPKAKVPEKSRGLILEFVGYRHMEKLLELKD